MIEIIGLLDVIGIIRALFLLWLILKIIELYLSEEANQKKVK